MPPTLQVYGELVSLRSSSSLQKSENNTWKEEVEKLTQSLQSEVSQNQERKKKVRAYVDNLTAEKAAAEEKNKGLEASLSEATDKRNVLGIKIAPPYTCVYPSIHPLRPLLCTRATCECTRDATE